MKSPLSSSESSPRKILIRGVNWLGDAVMSMPAIQRLKEAHPQTQITILTPEKLADLWRLHPCVEDAIAITKEESVFQVGRRLRWGNFDAGLIFPNSPRTAIELWLAKIPRRIGYARPWRNFFLTQKISPRADEVKMHKRSLSEIKKLTSSPANSQPSTLNSQLPSPAHHVHQYLHLAAEAFGANPEPMPPRLVISATLLKNVKSRFQLPEDGRPLFGLNPGAEYGAAKRWPEERFVAAAVEVQKNTHCRWLIFGGKADTELAERIATQIQQALSQNEKCSFNLAGQTSLGELCAALKACRVLLTNDTGPMHVAAAVGTPVVVPFGSTSSELTGPISGETTHQLLQSDARCSPCFLRECPIDFRCMTGISVERVVKAVSETVRNNFSQV